MPLPDLCLYHANCADGFGAAWAVWSRFGDRLEYLPAAYGDPPPDVTGRHVVLVDFSYKRPVLERMAATAASILILDHHPTAEEDLAPFAANPPGFWEEHLNRVAVEVREGRLPVSARFSHEHSGAVMAWAFFQGGKPTPKLLRFVEDRDLWRFALTPSRVLHATLTSYPFEFLRWTHFAAQCEQPEELSRLLTEGEAIQRSELRLIEHIIETTARTMIIGGTTVKVGNFPRALSSEGIGLLAQGEPFAAGYYDTAGGRIFSLRARGDSAVNLSEIAKLYGGGGHKQAAGFQVPPGWEGDEPTPA